MQVLLRSFAFPLARASLACLLALAYGTGPVLAQTTLVRLAAPAEAPALACDNLRSGLGMAVALAASSDGAAAPTLIPEPVVDDSAVPAARAEPRSRLPRIAIWGDSHTAAGPFVDTLLEAWGLPRAQTLPSFIPPSFGQPNVRLPLQKACVGGEWRLRTAHRTPGVGARFAKGLDTLSSEGSGAMLAFDFRDPAPTTRLQWLDLVYSKDDPDRVLVLGLRVNGGPEQLLFLHGHGAPRLRVQAEVPLATLHLRLVAGQMNLEGLVPAYVDAPAAATVDVFSIPGATVAGWQSVDVRYLATREARPVDYDLVLFQYGTNDAVGKGFDTEGFAQSMRAALRQLREVYPTARCIVVGPPDRGAPGAGARSESRRFSLAHALVASVQERTAREFRCSFWNWQAAMGGPGSAQRWLHESPRLMRADLIHLTADGYTQSAQSLARALPLKRR